MAGPTWSIRSGTTYLNHGSFGPPTLPVQQAQQDVRDRMAGQPMDFFVRHFEDEWCSARDRLAEFVGSRPSDLVFVENATGAMNVIAHSFPLQAGDDVLLTDHAYGAVVRVWQRVAETAGAEIRIANLPARIESADQVVDAILDEASARTRLLVVSHVTSPTAVVLPVDLICQAAAERGIAVCIDGPHAPAHRPLDIGELECDFYTASLHKWLSAPFGSGFLFVAPPWQSRIQTPQLSWARIPPRQPSTWWEEFLWTGTRDPSAYLSVPTAIDVLAEFGWDPFRRHGYLLAQTARQAITELTGLPASVPDSPDWYGCMASVPLPPGDALALQQALWNEHRIEVPVVQHLDQRSIRVSCHLYNTARDIDQLVAALTQLLRREG